MPTTRRSCKTRASGSGVVRRAERCLLCGHVERGMRVQRRKAGRCEARAGGQRTAWRVARACPSVCRRRLGGTPPLRQRSARDPLTAVLVSREVLEDPCQRGSTGGGLLSGELSSVSGGRALGG